MIFFLYSVFQLTVIAKPANGCLSCMFGFHLLTDLAVFKFYYQNLVLLIIQNVRYAVHPNFTCRLVDFSFCGGRYNFFLANCCD